MHRLFLGLPIEADTTAMISGWAASELPGVRTVPPENLHVTLLFFGSVDTAMRNRLVALTREAVWEPMEAQTGALAAFGKSALALRLEISKEGIQRLENRLARTCQWSPPGLSAEQEAEWFGATWPKDDPLFRMALLIPEPEVVQKRRRQRQRRPLELHLTVARTKSKPPFALSEKRLEPVRLTLDRLALYESHLGPEGSRYEVLAEAFS